jgi:hypothetical protein
VQQQAPPAYFESVGPAQLLEVALDRARDDALVGKLLDFEPHLDGKGKKQQPGFAALVDYDAAFGAGNDPARVHAGDEFREPVVVGQDFPGQGHFRLEFGGRLDFEAVAMASGL